MLALTSSIEDDTAFIWDIARGGVHEVLKGCASTSCAISLCGSRYIVAAMQNQPRIMAWQRGKEQPVMKCIAPERIVSLKCTHDGSFILGGGQSGRFFAWEAGSGRLLAAFEAHYATIAAIAITDDDSFVITAGADAVLYVWLLASVVKAGTSPPQPRCTWSDHTLPVTTLLCGAGGCNGRVVSGSMDNSCKFWDIPSGELVLSVTFPTPILTMSMDMAETNLFAAGEDGKIYKLSLLGSRGELSDSAKAASCTLEGHDAAVSAIVVSHDGRVLLSTASDGSAKVWDAHSQQAVGQFIQHKGPINAALLLPAITIALPGAGFSSPPAVLQRRPWQQEEGALWEIEAHILTTQRRDNSEQDVTTGDELQTELRRIQGSEAALREENQQWKAFCNDLHQQSSELCIQSLSNEDHLS